jgi:hypothetical protein
MKHNKKRNTAFLYEILLREGTKASLEKDFNRLKEIKKIILECFHPDTALGFELSLYKNLLNDIEKENNEKVLFEVKTRHSLISRKTLFNEQTELINKINEKFGFNVYNNFIPNYKDLATISQIFNDSTPIKEKILLEQKFVEDIKLNKSTNEKLKPIDSLVYKTFVKKFNDKYSGLLSEQKDLLTKYVSSFADDGLELKVYLNEEIESLNKKIKDFLLTEEIKNDQILFDKTKKLLEVLSNLKNIKNISEDGLENILKIQQFVYEVNN